MRCPRARPTGPRDERGFALVVVLLVLLALLVLCTPFLVSARNADRASTQQADRAEARLALDGAARHARLVLGASHPALDATPYFDTEEELALDLRFDPGFLDPADAGGTMWKVDPADVAGRIDLNSAPPHVIANLIGASTRFAAAIEPRSKELPISSGAGFEPSGFAWAGGELVRYAKIENGGFTGFERGLLGPPEDEEWRGGPKPASLHDAGAPVLDQRAFAPCLWRLRGLDGTLSPFDSVEEVHLSAQLALSNALSATADDARARASAFAAEVLAPLALHASVHGGIRAGSVWRHPTRLVLAVKGGLDGQLVLESLRWVNPGSTVEIRQGEARELALIQEVASGRAILDRVLVNDYDAWEAEVRVLARRPVNLNTASSAVLEALFANLQMVGRNARITKDEAATLAALVVESRPFDGFEDFLRRIVLPAGGLAKLPADAPVFPAALQGQGGVIDDFDALALYANGLDANDGSLAYATMPYAFTSRDTYAFELRASVNAPSGVERTSLVREQVELVVPQRELFTLWARQADFDEAIRLDGEAPCWMAGPKATWSWDNGASPPSPLWPNVGRLVREALYPDSARAATTNSQAASASDAQATDEHVFASREEEGWIQLWPARILEGADTPRLRGKVLHFDRETREPEGRFLPDEVVLVDPADAERVGWVDGAPSLLRPMALSLWFKPRTFADGVLFDLGADSRESDRVSLVFDAAKQDFVLRVLDGAGDHPDSPLLEAAEARYGWTPSAESPGLTADTWNHVAIDVRGTRPDQIHVLVNGLAHGVRVPGLTRLSAGVDPQSIVLTVESIEGFPDVGVVQIGPELVEYQLDAANLALVARPIATGAGAGQGGRQARERRDHAPQGDTVVSTPFNPGLSHPADTAVRLYGYSAELASNVGTGSAPLPAALGAFQVAQVAALKLQGTSQPAGAIITERQSSFDLGNGLDGGSALEEIVLGPITPGSAAPDEAFPAGGGYVMLVQRRLLSLTTTTQGPGGQTASYQNLLSTNNAPIGGVELLRYTSRVGSRLLFAPGERGDQHVQFPAGEHRVQRAFLVQWDPTLYLVDDPTPPVAERLEWRVFAIPVSIPALGAGALTTFPKPVAGRSEVAQITELSAVEQTEWVRYDAIGHDHLVRCSADAALAAYESATRSAWGATTSAQAPGQPGGQQPMTWAPPAPPLVAAATAPPPTAAAQAASASAWSDMLGTAPANEDPVTRAVRTELQFRGVLGTHPAAHAAGALVLPVFRTARRGDADGGLPGAGDHAFLLGAEPDDLGTPVVVHRAYSPSNRVTFEWDPAPGQPLVPVAGAGGTEREDPEIDLNAVYVGLRAAVAIPYTPGTVASSGANALPSFDARLRARLVKHPSGELPRLVTRARIGGGFDGQAASGVVPPAVVDEVVFGAAEFGDQTPLSTLGTNDVVPFLGGLLRLEFDLDDVSLSATLVRTEIRAAHGVTGAPPYNYLNELPQDAGLLRIGGEILAYNHVDPDSGLVTIAPGGRGLFGTRAQPHHARDTVQLLEHHEVSFLAGDVGSGDARLPLGDLAGFEPQGTVLVGSELVHYTRKQSGALEMPRASTEPGRQDGKGEGLFRGRFGTEPAAHTTGEAVIAFPFRYWDRWAARADAPELSYFKLGVDQPNAFWSSFFFVKRDTDSAEIGVLARSDPDVPWDADPERDPRLQLFTQGDQEGRPLPLGMQTGSLEWRVFVRYLPGAFVLEDGSGQGWRQTPRLERLGAFYFGPGEVLRSVER